MKDQINISVIQADLRWEDKSKNLAKFESLCLSIKEPMDLIVLPEMFTTGFSMNVEELAEEMDGQSVFWMKAMSKLKNCVISGTLIIKEEDKFFNRHLWISPNGEIEYYDKRHLFRLAKEHNYYTAGTQQKVVDLHGWKVNLNTCYDLRFPVWSRNQMEYDIILNAANWPVPRINAWKVLNQARAIENLAYVVACNRVGEDAKGNLYSGESAIVDFSGEVIQSLSMKEGILNATLDKTALQTFRTKFPFHQDKDTFSIEL